MIVVISTNLPKRVKGVLKIWMLEIKAGVFIGNINKKIEDRIFKFLMPYVSDKYELIVIRSNATQPQGFDICLYNFTNLKTMSGLYLTQIKNNADDLNLSSSNIWI